MPIYNTGDDISNTVKCLKEQTYKNFEVIFVDDCSTDNTMDILKHLLEESKLNYKIILNSKNQGVSYSRNNGINHSKGDYIYFLDSDDFIETSTFQSMIEYLKNQQTELVFGGFDRINSKGETFFTYKQAFKYYSGCHNGLEVIKELLLNHLWISIGAVIFKKAIIDKYNISFTVGCHNGEDQEFIMKFLFNASRVYCFNQVVFHYYQRLNSITNSKSLKRITVVTAFNNLYWYFKDYKADEELIYLMKIRKLPIEVIKNVDKLPGGWIYMELPNGLKLEQLKDLVRPFRMNNYGIYELKLLFKIKLFLFSPKLFCSVMNGKGWSYEAKVCNKK